MTDALSAVSSSLVRPFKRILVANRGEIAIRVFRAATELGIGTVAIYAHEDRLGLHRFKADESYLVGEGKGPVLAYLDIDDILRIAREAKVDAIHPGYGFLSENPEFAEACAAAGITFIGPSPDVMRRLGNKVAARNLAEEAGVPVVPATPALPDDLEACAKLAEAVGYPLMLKASWGGGGRGMRVVESAEELPRRITEAKREAKAAFGNDEVYLEKLVRRARHVEVQILGDTHGNTVHLYERDCSVQRRNQKVVERAPAPYLTPERREEVCAAGLRLVRHCGYSGAGTVEFLMDADTGAFYFIEVNPRVQVEHTVTEQVTGIDIVKAQILIAQGARIGDPADSGVPVQEEIRLHGHALQCRVTTEDPDQNFIPDYGRITAYRGATGFGIRLDGGTAYSGAVITRYYDSLLEKVTAWGPTPTEAAKRMVRALREFRIRGVATNLPFLEAVVMHPTFLAGEVTTRFIDETPELLEAPARRDRATKMLKFIGEVMVNGNPEMKGRTLPATVPPQPHAPVPGADLPADPPAGTKQRLDELGPEKFAEWMKAQTRLLVTDTTLRDAHQSLLATRMRSFEMMDAAPLYARGLPQLFSLECWGGATFDVSMRFLKEDPWERLREIRRRVPNILLQMLLRASNAVGYTNYPDNVVKHFVHQAAQNGVDVFRVFDSLNWTENMGVAMEAVRETGMICEAAVCYTGDIDDPARHKYDLKYYVEIAKELERMGAHVLGIKDMAGVCKPFAVRKLVTALKEEVGLPIHFHTHDTSGFGPASLLAAAEAGVDVIDAAIDSMSGLTSQPNLGSLAACFRGQERDTELSAPVLRQMSTYWEQARKLYGPFESEIRSGTSDVYRHEMPGGQYTNLREQARSLGIGDDRWPEVSRAYAEVNEMFGDIVKVTPTSKVVGDMALTMVTGGLTREDVLSPEKDISFPDSVISLFRGDLGHPPGGFPVELQKKVLKGEAPRSDRPGAELAPVDLEAERAKLEDGATEADLASRLMYPQVYETFAAHRETFGDTSVLPTEVFFYGMQPGQEVSVTLEPGKTLVIRCQAIGELHEDGTRSVFFELNGQPRTVRVKEAGKGDATARPKADENNPGHLAAPMPGLVSTVAVTVGQTVTPGDLLATLEAMKMETSLHAEIAGTVEKIEAGAGSQVEAKELIMVIAPKD
jgi:pyruvate carboxylase